MAQIHFHSKPESSLGISKTKSDGYLQQRTVISVPEIQELNLSINELCLVSGMQELWLIAFSYYKEPLTFKKSAIGFPVTCPVVLELKYLPGDPEEINHRS